MGRGAPESPLGLVVLFASRLMRKFLPLLYASEFLSLPGDLARRLGCDRASEAFVGDWYDARVGVASCDLADSGPESLCLFGEGGSAMVVVCCCAGTGCMVLVGGCPQLARSVPRGDATVTPRVPTTTPTAWKDRNMRYCTNGLRRINERDCTFRDITASSANFLKMKVVAS